MLHARRGLIRALCRCAKTETVMLTNIEVIKKIQAAHSCDGRYNNSFNASGHSLLFIRKIEGLVRCFPPR
jgi:hypothetical protein